MSTFSAPPGAPEPYGDPIPGLPPPGTVGAPPPGQYPGQQPGQFPGQFPGQAPPGGDGSDDIPGWLLGVLGVVLIAMLAGVAFFVLRPDGSPAEAGRTYPTAWDKRIAPYAKIAENTRDLRFQHPVEVRFLSAKAFEKTVTTDGADLTAEDRTQLDQFTGQMRALGLLTGDVDLFESMNQAQSSGILAYYSFESETITVRGKKVTPDVAATLVHELTHVLQDQNFSVGRRMLELKDVPDDEPSSNADTMLRSIVEGDAERVAELYRQSLSRREQKKLDQGRDAEIARNDRETKDVPKVLITLLSSPYTLGSGLVQAVAQTGDNNEVDDLLRDPPSSETALLEPLRELVKHQRSETVKVPGTRTGEEAFSSGELGAVTWYLMLSERLPLRQALDAADGWGGDGFVAFEEEGRACVRARYAGGTRADTRTMELALTRWSAAAPQASVSVKSNRRFVKFESCDPGTESTIGRDASVEAVNLLMTRTGIGLAFMKAGATPRVSSCIANGLVHTYGLKDLQNPEFGAGDASVQLKVAQISSACKR